MRKHIFPILILLCFFLAVPGKADVITDVTGPEITEAFCDKQGQTLKPGDVVYFSFKASDPSGLRESVSVNFYEATSYRGHQFDWTYDAETGIFETVYTVPEDAKNGEYYISTIYMYDIYDNQSALSVHLGFFVDNGQPDTDGPEITEAFCDKQGQTLKPGDVAHFSFKASDPSGLRERVSVNFFEATSYRGHQFDWTYDAETGIFETAYTVPEDAKNGEYYISTIYMYDIHNNQSALSVHLGFFVEGGISDLTGPTVTEAKCDKQGQSLKPGDVVHFSFKASDPSGLRETVSVNFFEATSYRGHQFDWTYDAETGIFETAYTVPESPKVGEYYISTIYMYDIHNNQSALSVHLGFFVEPDGHDFGDWVVTKPATNTEQGEEMRKCAICGLEETRGIDKLGNPFADVQAGAFYEMPVLWAVENGVTTGTSENTFAPNATCTRGQIVTFLWRAKGSPEPKSTANPFRDVSKSAYFYKAVLWAVENGITTGTSATTFSPNDGCTRGQVATFLWRAEGQTASGGNNIFTDISTGAYYYDAVLWAVAEGITNGMGDGLFAPNAHCTRGQIVTFLHRAMT